MPLGTLLTKHVGVTVLGTFIMLGNLYAVLHHDGLLYDLRTAAAPVGLHLPRNEVLWMLMMAVLVLGDGASRRITG